MSDRLVPDSDNVIWLDNLFDTVDAEFIAAGTVTFVVNDSSGNPVSGASGSLTYVGGDNRSWVGVCEDGVTLTPGAAYTVVITVTASNDRVRRFDSTINAARGK